MRKTRWITVILVLLASLALVGVALAQEGAPETAVSSAPQEKAPEGVTSVSYIYTNTTPVAIPDNLCTTGYVTTTLYVTDSFTIADLNVGLWASHTWRSDMDIRLVHPDGTIIDLLLDPDSGGDNLNTLLDDSSPNLASSDTTNHVAPPPYYTAWYRPTSSLSAFTGKDSQGTWTIRACDDATGDTGSLNTWTLFFETGLVMNAASTSGSACEGNDVDYTFNVVNATGVTQSFTITYASDWPYAGPLTTGEIGAGDTGAFVATVHVPNTAAGLDTDAMTVTVSSATDSDQSVVTTQAALVEGYTDYANLTAGRGARAPSVVYYDGKLYKIGGYGGTGAAQAWLDIYDIAANTWSTGADMPGIRYWMDCEAIAGKIYCAGGYSTSAQSTLYIYDIATNSWSTGASLPAGRYQYAGASVGGKYYVIGGWITTYTNTILAYDPATDTWDTTLPSMTTTRRYHSAGVIGGKIYVAGGYNGVYLNSVEVYDPVANTWGAAANMPSAWVNAADAVKHDRFLLLLGGASSSTSGASNGALIYDALLDTWSSLPYLDHVLYNAEADYDGNDVWVVSGRLYENSTFSYSHYTFKVDQCTGANADLSCDKTDSGDPINYSETITYTLFVTNTGNADGWNTIVTDTLPAGVAFVSASPECVENAGIVTCDIGSLRNGVSEQYEIVVTAPVATTLLTNTVEIASDEDDLDLTNNSASETTQVTNASISLVKTVGDDPTACAAASTLDVLSGAEVTYCYTVLNTGSVTFTAHTLVDDQLGTILLDSPYTLSPGASAFITESAVITQTTTNVATWTATDGALSTDESASATVTVVPATITLNKTVGTDPTACATTDAIYVPVGVDVTYCFEVTNTSPAALITHTLVDDQLGAILLDFPYTLAPGASAFITATANITETTVNTATWTATDGVHTAIDDDTATVNVLSGCGLTTENFNAGTAGFPPSGWTVVDNLTTGTHCPWRSSQATGSTNLTGGDGFFADANSDSCGSGSQMNTDLYSPFFTLDSASSAILSYRYDYNDLAVADYGAVDISVDGGATWINLATYLDDARGPATELVDLAAFAGAGIVQLRFHYEAPGWDWWFQVDDVFVTCNPTPEIDVTPTVISTTLLINGATQETINIANLDLGALDWDADEGCGSPVDWMTIDPISGTIAAYSNADVAVDLDATGLSTGQYVSSICINSNDADEPVVTIPVTLNVIGQPVIGIEPLEFFAAQGPDIQSTQVMTIANSGNLDLIWSIVEAQAATADGSAPHTLTLTDLALAPVAEGVAANEGLISNSFDASAPVWDAPEAVLWDNGPLVTHPGGGAGGFDASRLQNSTLLMTTLGFGNQFTANNSMADDFTVDGYGWNIDTFTFFSYQTGSSTASTITGIYYRIWDGDPTDPNSAIIFGDLVTNRFVSSAFSGIYRDSETTIGNNTRPIMATVAAGGVSLAPGTYWVEWTTAGSLASGPWAPPVTIIGQVTTGNAYQNQAGVWVAANDGGTLTRQDLPFIIEGEIGCIATDLPWLSASPTDGVTAPGNNDQVDVTFDSTGMTEGVYTGLVCVQSNDPDMPEVAVPVTLTVESGYVPTWDKEIWINGMMYTPDDYPSSLVNGDTVTIVDHVSVDSLEPITFTLTEEWAGMFDFVSADADFGVVTVDTGMISWDVTDGVSNTLYTLTKTFSADISMGWDALVTETLAIENGPAPDVILLGFSIPAYIEKSAPDLAYTGEVIPYTIVIQAPSAVAGTVVLTDALPAGVEYAGNLNANYGNVTYDAGDNAVYWNNVGVQDILWEQTVSAVQTGVYANQDFFTADDAYDIFVADDFTNAAPWNIGEIFVPGGLWNGGTTLANASALNFEIYADDGGEPDGDPYGNGNPPVWSASLPPTDPQIVLSNGIGGLPSNATIVLDTPINLPAGTWWLVFYPTMDFTAGGQYGRHVSDTTNGADAVVINPGGGFGFPAVWTPITDAGTFASAQQDLAFRIESVPAPATITITFDVTVTGEVADVVNMAFLDFDGTLMNDAAETTVVAEVTFVYYDLEDVVLDGETVRLAGDFTGDWASAVILDADADETVFTATLLVPVGDHEYKYQVLSGPDTNWNWLQSNNREVTVAGLEMLVEDYRNIEPGYYVLQWPPATTTTVGAPTENIYAQIWADDLTSRAGETRALQVELGYGDTVTITAWSWVAMAWDSQQGNNDQFVGVITPAAVGEYYYAVRFNGNWGEGNPNDGWYYGDLDWSDPAFVLEDSGILTVIVRTIFLPLILRAP